MQHTLSESDVLLVAEYKGVPSGFCAVDTLGEETAAVVLLLVDPANRRCGIATELMRLVQALLRQGKTECLTLGAGCHDYFWPGLPQEQESAWSFFAKQGFQEQQPMEDLVQELGDFQTPEWVSARQRARSVTLCLAEPASATRINAFEREHFPAWAPYFEEEMERDGYRNILFAHGPDQEVLGTIFMKEDSATPWQVTRGRRIGSLNTLGVDPSSQGQGIGLALTAGAMEHLRDRACSACYIQWTELADWYGKLGAKPWARYLMASKRFILPPTRHLRLSKN